MIQMQTNLDVADNSGARRVQCIKVLGGRIAVMQVSVTSSKLLLRKQFLAVKLKGDVLNAVVVRTRKGSSCRWFYHPF